MFKKKDKIGTQSILSFDTVSNFTNVLLTTYFEVAKNGIKNVKNLV